MQNENEKKGPTYKEINGTTRTGDFLRAIGKSELLQKAFNLALNGASGGFFEVLKGLLQTTPEVSDAERKQAIELINLDIKADEEISKRHSSDMLSDSWLSKNVRPLVLLYSWFLITLMIFGAGAIQSAYIQMVQILALTVNTFYFGSRGYLQYKQIKNK